MEIGPENPQKREEPDLVPLELQDVEKNDDEKVGKKVRPHRQFPIVDRDRARDEHEKTDQQFRPVLVPADKGKTDEQGDQKIEEAPQDDQAVIIRPLKDLVNDGLKKPVVVIPRLRGRDIAEEGIIDDGAVLPEIPPA